MEEKLKAINYFVLLIFIILISCEKKVDITTNIFTSGIEGYVALENGSTDTTAVSIKIFQQFDRDTAFVRETDPDDNGYFFADKLQPGYYQIVFGFEVRNYRKQTHSATLFIDNITDLGILDFQRYDRDASFEGYVNFVDASPDTLTVDIDIFWIEEGDSLIFGKTVQTNEQGFYSADSLFPGDYKLAYFNDFYGEYQKYLTLFPQTMTIVDTVSFEEIYMIEFMEIMINGIIDNGWESSYENTHTSGWGTTNDFDNLYLAFDEDSLYIAVDGGFDPAGNTINIYFDKDYEAGTGINDFSQISGGGYGDHLRKNVMTPENFGADLAFSGWSLTSDIGVVSLVDPQAVDQNVITDANIFVSSTVIEIALPITDIYDNGEIPAENKIALVGLIGGGGDEFFADDTIPQQNDASNFETVFEARYDVNK